ncbi:S8 family serine peptidase [Streptomyces sp. NPDC050095]|uniref:S8 family peptidase n=1 Tax=unclassified Streptomyces TaxID=2593676 RepID=UPI00341F7BF3
MALVAATATVIPAAGAPAAGADPSATALPATVRGGTAVTLVTGDTVTLKDGKVVGYEPGEGRESIPYATVRGADGHVSVTPADAQALVAGQRVDPRLFDVTGLVRQKYQDAQRSTLPLIADGAPPSSPVAARTLPALGFSTGAVPKDEVEGVWKSVTSGATDRLWLDGKRAELDTTSTAQIGAPAAWAKGLTGKGVTVAVLDTGADATHPDLAGAIAESKDFTGEGNTDDGTGHGTHTASTIGGRGTAYPSVAPGASLAIGKVLNKSGQGSDSMVLAGMEWAAKDIKADVVSMSLGGTDLQGTDPLEAAVNELSASTDSLFVIAAGNDGKKGDRTIGSPGSADAALTVGAVDSTGTLADFSSTGPRIGDYGVKPDIAAPGVDITAAKPGGGYQAMSGTSMATPHVAGAAALLKQEHPTWDGEKLKSALIGSAKAEAEDYTAFRSGAGQLDVAAAVDTAVTAEPANASTYLTYGTRSATRTVTYTNDGDKAVSLSLDEHTPGIRLSDDHVRVSPHGTASVQLLIGDAKPGAYSGTLVAKGAHGVRVTTVIGAYIEPKASDVTVNFLDFNGNPVTGQAWAITNMKTGDSDYVVAEDGTGTVHLPAGEYAMPVYFKAKNADGKSVAVMANVPVTVTGADRTVNVDARDARLATGVLDDKPGANALYQNVDLNRAIGDVSVAWQTGVTLAGTTTMVIPAKGKGLIYRHHVIMTPAATDTDKKWQANLVDYRTGVYPAEQTHHASLAALAKTRTTYKGQAFAGTKSPTVQLAAVYPDGTSDRSWRVTATVGNPYAYYVENAVPGLTWYRTVLVQGSGGGSTSYYDQRALSDGDTETYGGAAFGPRVASGEAVRDGDTLTLALGNPMSDAEGHIGASPGAGTVTLSQADGTQLATAALTGYAVPLTAELPTAKGTYALSLHQQRDGWAGGYASAVDTRWTFASRHTGSARDLPLTSLAIAADGLTGNNATPYGTTTPLTVIPLGDQRITSLTAEASFDGGATWTSVAMSLTTSGSWGGSVTNPASGSIGGAAMLRVTAHDSYGGSVTQTVTRAYGLGDQ